MDVTLRKLSEIRPYENNPRKNDEAVQAVAASIKEFGFKQPIVVDVNGVIIAGHTRYKAAKKLKLKEVPVVVADDLTEDQVKAYRLADNKTGELAEWDFSLLDEELGNIGIEIDMGQFGFDLPDGPNNQTQSQQDVCLQEESISPYRYVHYLVTIDVNDHDKFLDKIDELQRMGAVVKETRNNT